MILNPSPMSAEFWNTYTRNHDGAHAGAIQFTGTNCDEVARVPGIRVEEGHFVSDGIAIRIAKDEGMPPEQLMVTDYLVLCEGRIVVWNQGSFLNAFKARED
jgi:hypothetical protein